MNRPLALLTTWLLLAGLAAPCLADERAQTPARLATFDELERRLKESDLRVLDARPRPDYDAGHIPGAVWADVKAAEALAARPGGLTDRAAWEKWVAPLAIGPDAEVLVYDANRQLDAARLWWLLGYLGVERVGLIDGNYPLWQRQGRPVTTDVPEVEPRPFPVSFRTERLATRADVLEALTSGGAQVIDARSEGEYTGAETRSRRGGHIPEACPLEWSGLVDADGRFLDPAALRSRLQALGVKPGAPVITHCQGGGRASVDAFALERLGFPARNYYLGWSDWGNAAETPIATGRDDRGRPR
ncbi:MAG TPA: sulfurtransferase [Isosphaeraceae bacterium]|jgi:thiosulfate/3-mercaptopyruvate sulfurtransferase